MNARQPTPTPDKTCCVCGHTFNRKRRPNGTIEHLSEYRERLTCGRECGATLAKIKNTKTTTAAPCVVCGGDIPRRDGEPGHTWRSRKTCSPECSSDGRAASARKRATGNTRFTPEERAERDRARKRKARAAAVALRPERRVAFERFPEPASMRPKWQTVTGDALPALRQEDAVTGSPTRPANLRAALAYHPDLRTALAGLLTDSWAPFARGSGVTMHSERT